MNLSSILCWLGFHRWYTHKSFTKTHLIDWTVCERKGCSILTYIKQPCNYYGPDRQDQK